MLVDVAQVLVMLSARTQISMARTVALRWSAR